MNLMIKFAKNNYPNNVREYREERGLTREQLAKKTRKAIKTIVRAEQGYNISIDTKKKILKALKVDIFNIDKVFPCHKHPKTKI